MTGIDKKDGGEMSLESAFYPDDGSDPLLDEFDVQEKGPATRRVRSTKQFARIPLEVAIAVWPHISSAGWMILVELDRLVFEGRGRNPVKLPNTRLHELGISRYAKRRQLRKLETLGVVKIYHHGTEAITVAPLWHPLKGSKL